MMDRSPIFFARTIVWRPAGIAWSVALLLGINEILGSPAIAQTPPSIGPTTTPSTPYLEDSTLVGAGGTLTATRVPVTTATGSVVYWDLNILFNADVYGNLTLAPGYPKILPSPPLVASTFVAGNYTGPATVANGKFLVKVTGPGVGPNGTTIWSLATPTGADCGTYPATATWYTGAIADNPLASRLTTAKITYPDYAYGIVGANEACDDASGYLYFFQGALIGLTQIGSTLTIVSFSVDGTADRATPQAEITYDLSQ